MDFLFPLDSKYISENNITSSKYNPNLGRYGDSRNGGEKYHGGVDYKAPIGSNIYSAGSGTVIYSGYNNTAMYGNCIIIKHNNGTSTLYAHMNEKSPYMVGDKIEGRVKIGEVGISGNADSGKTHLHFEHLNKEGTKRVEQQPGNGGATGLPYSDDYRFNPEHSMRDGRKPIHFIWHSEGENSCDNCQSRDGEIFQYGVDQEPPLHPNCECWIEPIEREHMFDGLSEYEQQFGEYDSNEEDEGIGELEEELENAEKQLRELYDRYYETGDANLLEYINEYEEYIEELEEAIGEYKNISLKLEVKFLKVKNIKNECELKYRKKFDLYIRRGVIF